MDIVTKQNQLILAKNFVIFELQTKTKVDVIWTKNSEIHIQSLIYLV